MYVVHRCGPHVPEVCGVRVHHRPTSTIAAPIFLKRHSIPPRYYYSPIFVLLFFAFATKPKHGYRVLLNYTYYASPLGGRLDSRRRRTQQLQQLCSACRGRRHHIRPRRHQCRFAVAQTLSEGTQVLAEPLLHSCQEPL